MSSEYRGSYQPAPTETRQTDPEPAFFSEARGCDLQKSPNSTDEISGLTPYLISWLLAGKSSTCPDGYCHWLWVGQSHSAWCHCAEPGGLALPPGSKSTEGDPSPGTGVQGALKPATEKRCVVGCAVYLVNREWLFIASFKRTNKAFCP